MDWLAILDQYGIPIVVATAFGYFIWKQNQYIQKDLAKDIHTKFNRLEEIMIGLINQQKKMQLEQKRIMKSYESIIEIITALSGNGLSKQFKRKKEND
tara:strand:+ start:396 stop:689 length:294 start_codon:yes stop_codon:yes gene_type:complete